jgi:L-lactate dehydrogenase complex protein LldG
MSGRDQILASIRRGLGGGKQGLIQSRDTVKAALAKPQASPQPSMDWQTLEQFETRAKALSCTWTAIDQLAQVPRSVSDYLKGLRLLVPTPVSGWPTFADLDWAPNGISFDTSPVSGNAPVGLTGAFCAIAETGALMLLSGADTPAATSLLPETHIAVVRANQVVRTMEQAWSLLRLRPQPMPRAVNFVAGPSRTGDIEQTTTIGLHGPRRVHLILLQST